MTGAVAGPGAGPGAASGAAQASLRIRMRDAAAAQRLVRSLAADDAGSAAILAEGRDVIVACSAATAMGLLRTLDDLLGCVRAAEPLL